MNLPPLREYQRELKQRLLKNEGTNVTAQQPTGTGKTLVLLDLALNWVEKNRVVLIIVPTIELIKNLEYDLKRFAPFIFKHFYGVINSKLGKFQRGKRLYVGTFGSIMKYADQIKPDLVINDESHHTSATIWSSILDHFSASWQVGFTATPIRFDGKSLKKRFPVLLESHPLSWFIEQGFLSDYEIRNDGQTNARFSAAVDNLKKQQGIFDQYDLVGDAVKNYNRFGNARKAIVFATGKEHARHLATQFGDQARCILGDTPERSQWLEEFDSSQDYPILTNVSVITEGVNLKNAKVAQLCRHTCSLSLYLQMVGRVLRPVEGLKALILDHAGNVDLHGEPKDFIDWQELYNKPETELPEYFDPTTLYYNCSACAAPLCSLLESKSRTQIECPHCEHINLLARLSEKQLRSLQISDHLLVEYESVSTEIRQLSRIINDGRMFKSKKIEAIVNLKMASPDQKLAALISLGINQNLARNVYLKGEF